MRAGEGLPLDLPQRPAIYLNGVLDQCFNPEGFFTLPSEEAVAASVQRAKDIGLNLMRLHIKPESRASSTGWTAWACSPRR